MIPWRRLIAWSVVAVPLVAGCTKSSIGPAETMTAADSAAVTQLVQTWWTTSDPAVYSALYTADAVSLEPDGEVLRSREALVKEFMAELESFKDFRIEDHAVSTIKFLGPDQAVVEGGFAAVGPTPPALKYGYLAVLRRTTGSWRIEAASHTRVGGCC